MSKPVTLQGTVVRGIQGASTMSLVRQMPHFIQIVPQMASWFEGTLNLALECQLLVVNQEFATDFSWQGPDTAPERFYLHGIGIEFPVGSTPNDAWIYVPHNSPHFGNRNLAEVIAPRYEGIGYGFRCLIHIPKAKIEAGMVLI